MGFDRVCEAKNRHMCTKRVKQWSPRASFRLTLDWACNSLTCWYMPRRGYRPAELRHQGRDGTTRKLTFPVPEYDMKRKMIGGTTQETQAMHLAPVESNVFTRLPSLVGHCCVTRYDDREPRRPGWMTIKTMGAAWVVQVKDPDACASLTATAATLDDALALADLLVSSDEAPWEPDPFLKRMGGKKAA